MNGVDSVLYYFATALQLAAMFFAIMMMREVRDRRPWIALLAALAVTFVQRIFALTLSVETRVHIGPFAAVITSSLLFYSLFSLRRVAAAERASTQLAA